MSDQRGRLAAEQPVEVLEHLARVGIALVGPLDQGLGHHLRGPFADGAVERADAGSRLALEPGDQVEGRRSRERGPPGQEVEQRCPERVDVGRRPHGIHARRLFGRHVERGPENGPGLGQVQRFRLLGLPRQTKVGKLDLHRHRRARSARRDDRGRGRLPVLRFGLEHAVDKHDVIGLDVAVDDPPLVRHRQAARDVRDDGQRRFFLEARAGGQPAPQSPSLDVFQDKVVNAVVLVQFDVIDDERRLDRRQDSRFLREPLDRVGTLEPGAAEDLDGDRRPIGDILAPVDDPHPPLAQLLADQESAEPSRGRVRDRGSGSRFITAAPHARHEEAGPADRH